MNQFQLHARCERNPLAVEMFGGPKVHHLVFEPMSHAECQHKLMECFEAMENPDGWEFTIEPTDGEHGATT